LLFASSLGAAESDLALAAREYQQEHFDAALSALDRIEKSSASNAEALDLRGCVYMEQKKIDEAKKAFEAAHSANADLFAPRIHLADLLLREKKFAEARDAYRALLKETNILVSNERLRYAMLLTYLGEHNDTDGRAAFDAITFPTQTPAYYYAQAAWLFAHNKKSEAEDWLKQAQRLFDGDARAWFARHLYEFGWLKSKPPLSVNHG
jgi:predicted Zn-dependent protease